MTDFLSQLLNGLQVGSIYALVALGYTMVYGIIKLINFAHGEIIMAGSYMILMSTPFLIQTGFPLWISVGLGIIVCVTLGVFIERVAYRRLRNAPKLCSIITAIGMSLLLQNIFMLIYSPDPQPVDRIFKNVSFALGEVKMTLTTLLTIGCSVFLMILLQLFVKKTKAGKAMRAVSQDQNAAKLMGINVNKTIAMTFAIGSGLAAVASLFYLAQYPQVSPTMGSMLGLKAFVAAVLGGIGIIPGAMIGGVLMGILESMTKAYINSQLADAVVFGMLIVVLVVKPSGLFGKNIKEKV